jgi:hypothetical protein
MVRRLRPRAFNVTIANVTIADVTSADVTSADVTSAGATSPPLTPNRSIAFTMCRLLFALQ